MAMSDARPLMAELTAAASPLMDSPPPPNFQHVRFRLSKHGTSSTTTPFFLSSIFLAGPYFTGNGIAPLMWYYAANRVSFPSDNLNRAFFGYKEFENLFTGDLRRGNLAKAFAPKQRKRT
jgi:hypothetical protein